jgi:hypothetical protein
MEQTFQPGDRVRQVSTGKIGTIMRYDEHHSTTRTPFYHVQFDGESGEYAKVLESDLQRLR